MPDIPTIHELPEIADLGPMPDMNRESKVAKVALVLIAIGAVAWIGSINIRAVIGMDLLQFATLEFKPNLHPYIERAVFGLVAQSSLVAAVGYLIVWFSGIVFLRTTSLRFKEHGWMMMSVILFYVFTPVEIYTGILDFRMWLLDSAGSNDLVEFRKLFIHRLGALSGVPWIALLCYYTIIVLAVFRPFRKPSPVSAPTGLN